MRGKRITGQQPETPAEALRRELPDAKDRQFVHANGRELFDVTRDNPELMTQLHLLKNWEVREAGITHGLDLGQKHVGSRAGLGEAQIGRQEILSELVRRGVSPEDILSAAKQPVKTVPIEELNVGDTFVDKTGEPRRIVEITPGGKIRTADGTALTFQGGIEIRGELNSLRAQLARGGKFIEEPEREVPPAAGFTNNEVSTRVPTEASGEPNPHTTPLFVGMDEVMNAPGGFADKLAKQIGKYPGMRRVMEGITDTRGRLNAYIDFLAGNLEWLYSKMPDDIRGWTRQWYDTAHKDTRTVAEQNGISHPQAAGVYAVNSPQTEWDINRGRALRIIDINGKQQATVTTPEMLAKMVELDRNDALYRVNDAIGKLKDAGTKVSIEAAKEARALAKKGYRNSAFDVLREDTGAKLSTPASYWTPMRKILAGKSYGELPTKYKAPWLRAFDEAHNNRSYDVMAPDGSVIGKAMTGGKKPVPKDLAWGSMIAIEKSIEILNDGSRENISKWLGDEHKVRHFYNNIISPNSENPHATIDTHAVAAARISPFSQAHQEVTHNFSGPPTSTIGLTGTYPLILEAYRRAARNINARTPDLNLLPRELQSITWEQVRALFPKSFRNPDSVRAVEGIWRKFDRRELSLSQARNAIVKLAGGFGEPSWVPYLRGR